MIWSSSPRSDKRAQMTIIKRVGYIRPPDMWIIRERARRAVGEARCKRAGAVGERGARILPAGRL